MIEQEELVIRLKRDVLPGVFANMATIAEYGGRGSHDAAMRTETMRELGDLMECLPVSRLAAHVAQIVGKLADASPEKVAKKATWLEKITGRQIETKVRYLVARKQLDELIEAAQGVAQGVRDALASIKRLITAHYADVAQLKAHIVAGQEFLTENPDMGVPLKGALEFDNTRERFARKLANLATLLSSLELSVTQLKLTKAQAIDMLDRFEETTRVLVPVWRQHTLAIAATANMSPAMIAEAGRAHEALMHSLEKSVEGLQQQ